MKSLVAALAVVVVVAAGLGVYRLTNGDEERDGAQARSRRVRSLFQQGCGGEV
jgi:hypothetical protein